VATCKLNSVNPAAYITEALQAILNGHSQRCIEELMPWRFQTVSSLDAKAIGKALTARLKTAEAALRQRGVAVACPYRVIQFEY
jgi:IS66 C-terminal element